MITQTSIQFDERSTTVRVECIPTPSLLASVLAIDGHQELAIEALLPDGASANPWSAGEAVLRGVIDGTVKPTRVELEVRPGLASAHVATGRYRRGDEVVVRWVDGWNLPREVDGRTGIVGTDHEQPRRVGVEIKGMRFGRWWVPPSALRFVGEAPLCRWAAIKSGQPWRLT